MQSEISYTRLTGFTLLELMVVVAIIGVLAAYVGPRYFSQVGNSRRATAQAQMDALAKALDSYRLDMGNYPGTDEGLSALVRAPAGSPRSNGPYFAKALPVDPWGRAFRYTVPRPEGHDYGLSTPGKDGSVGGSGEDADLVY